MADLSPVEIALLADWGDYVSCEWGFPEAGPPGAEQALLDKLRSLQNETGV